MAIGFFSSKDIDEERVMYTKSDNKKFMNYDNANNFADELFNTLISRYPDNLEKRMEGSEFVLDSVNVTKWILDVVVYVLVLKIR